MHGKSIIFVEKINKSTFLNFNRVLNISKCKNIKIIQIGARSLKQTSKPKHKIPVRILSVKNLKHLHGQ